MSGHVLILKGLPASGKSTFALDLLRTDKTYKRVNMDSLRAMFDNLDYDRVDGKLVADMRDVCITQALRKGYNVVSDDTNLAAQAETQIRKLAAAQGAGVSVKFFDTPVDECIARDAKRTGTAHVGEAVIRDFHKRYLKQAGFRVENPLSEEELRAFAPYEYTPGLPWCVICDLDGTLADMAGKRGPFEFHRVGEDELREAVAFALNAVRSHPEPTAVIFMSGRDDDCREQTEEWLRIYEFSHDGLYMRRVEDKRKDNLVKLDLFNEHIRDKYNVRFVLDDRQQVVDMWRQLGIDCFQVQPGDF